MTERRAHLVDKMTMSERRVSQWLAAARLSSHPTRVEHQSARASHVVTGF
ncbi:MAG: hypothetical protein U5O16_00105 [Rhodococcus sp. (in: high G+C Gram-positive bacteria)]|nr:hypothetical protein [Rhodococcus sp. (in: high G+C Gram-positive bacteria)]